MTTKTKRVQVVFRTKILESIEALSKEEELSLSKTVSTLVEEALVQRGIFQREVINPSPFASFYLK